MGIDYAEHLISAVNRPAEHYRDQPWGQVPVLRDGDVRLFESGAILLHLAEKDEALLPRDPQGRATVTRWLFAASNSSSEERRAGNECVSTWRSRGSPEQ